MSYFKLIRYMFPFILSAVLLPLAGWAFEPWPVPKTYVPTYKDMVKEKATCDDKTDLFVTLHPKDTVPPEMWSRIHWDVGQMQELWAEIVGFKSPDLVNKIAPEIKPGKYTYKDVQETPGFMELFPPVIRPHIKQGGPPFIMSIMDFELEPTKQFHLALPPAQITKQNLGKTKLDKDGYIVKGTWQGGFPFPKPSGKFKAQQIYYNFDKRCANYDSNYILTGEGLSFDKNLNMDKYNAYERQMTTFMGRTFMEPYGWFDERAKKRGQWASDVVTIHEPRSTRGTIRLLVRYDDPRKMDPFLMYLPMMRRIRKMSATDTQDPSGDQCFDDYGLMRQKITPKKYPYKFEIIEEREYLLPWSYNAGKSWLDSKNGYAIRGMGFMRRPCYVLQMTQLDKNYVYSKRIYYVDKETFMFSTGTFYDQKGRLYRYSEISRSFNPECGQIVSQGTPSWQIDYVDTHSSCQSLCTVPAQYARKDFNISELIKRGK